MIECVAEVFEEQAFVELHDSEAIQVDTMDQLRQREANVAATPDPRLNFEVEIDGEGNTSVDGEKTDLDELRAKLVKLKDETSIEFSVHIYANSECPVKDVVAVFAVYDNVGDVDYRLSALGVLASLGLVSSRLFLAEPTFGF